MKSFDLIEPATLDEAVALLDPEDPGVRAIAGATALMLLMKARLFQPARLVSLRRLTGALRGVRDDANGGLRIGAMTTLSELERSPLVGAALPVLSRALRTLSNVRIRNVATLGGHLAHGDPHLDLPPILMTLGARVRAVSRRGERWIDMAHFAVGYYQTAIARDELIAEIEVPAQPAGVRTWYAKFTALSADDWPAVGVAVWYRVDAGRIAEARVAVSAATDRPLRVAGAEAALVGAFSTPSVFARAADAAADEVEPLPDIRGSAVYKREMVRVHVRRALERALHAESTPAA
jgi:aerobic carbon-monoxide dehydrogenase medium subunit